MRVEEQRLRCIQSNLLSTSTQRMLPKPSRASAGQLSPTCSTISLVSCTCDYDKNITWRCYSIFSCVREETVEP